MAFQGLELLVILVSFIIFLSICMLRSLIPSIMKLQLKTGQIFHAPPMDRLRPKAWKLDLAMLASSADFKLLATRSLEGVRNVDWFIKFIYNVRIKVVLLFIWLSSRHHLFLPGSWCKLSLIILLLHKQVYSFFFFFLIFVFDYIKLSMQEATIAKVLKWEHRWEEKEKSRYIKPNTKNDISLWHQFM